jgi:hypothetical protein
MRREHSSWLKKYEADLAELDKALREVLPVDLSKASPEEMAALGKELEAILPPIKDGRVHPRDLERSVELWWERWGANEKAS